MAQEAICNMAFRRHHMSQLLHRVGSVLPRCLTGPPLAQASRDMEQLCWRDLGLPRQPIFDGDLPAYLIVDATGHPVDLSNPTDSVKLAVRMAALGPSTLPTTSFIGTNFSALVRLLNLTPFESQWLLWSYCVHCFGRATLPGIPLRDDWHASEILALLADIKLDAVQSAVASRRLHVWGFLDGRGADGKMPSLLSGWLSATDQFADLIEQPYASDSELLTALCQAHVSLRASR